MPIGYLRICAGLRENAPEGVPESTAARVNAFSPPRPIQRARNGKKASPVQIKFRACGQTPAAKAADAHAAAHFHKRAASRTYTTTAAGTIHPVYFTPAAAPEKKPASAIQGMWRVSLPRLAARTASRTSNPIQ